MEFAEGGQVNDKDYLKKHGISVNEVPSDMDCTCAMETNRSADPLETKQCQQYATIKVWLHMV